MRNQGTKTNSTQYNLCESFANGPHVKRSANVCLGVIKGVLECAGETEIAWRESEAQATRVSVRRGGTHSHSLPPALHCQLTKLDAFVLLGVQEDVRRLEISMQNRA